MAKKKSTKKKKSPRKAPVRRASWSDVFSPSIIDQVLAPALIQDVHDGEAFANAPSLARLHALFEDDHACSIPRDLFNRVAEAAGISFSRSISLGRNVNLPTQRQTADDSFGSPGDQIRRTVIPTPSPSGPQEAVAGDPDDETDGFRITNDTPPSARDEVMRQAQIDAALAEANGEIPEPVIIPRR
jgi:hypothetical protein